LLHQQFLKIHLSTWQTAILLSGFEMHVGYLYSTINVA